jgi:hypothetical protein
VKVYEKRIAAILLERAANLLDNRSCNDFDLKEAELTKEEMRELVINYFKWNGSAHEAEEVSDKQLRYALGDSSLMSFLADRLREVRK